MTRFGGGCGDYHGKMSIDHVADAYFDYFRRNGKREQRAIDALIADALRDFSPRVYARRDATTARTEELAAVGEHLMSMVEAICRRHDRARLLLLFRMSLSQTVPPLLQRWNASDAETVSLVFVEGMLFGTNCILTFSPELRPMEPGQRFDFGPTDDEIRDASHLALLCFMHRFNIFTANSAARAEITSPVSFDMLIDSYNKRQERTRQGRVTEERRAIVLPMAAITIQREPITAKLPDGEGGELVVWLRSFVPGPVAVDPFLEPYRYLSQKSGFEKHLGVPFETWVKVWVTMNCVLGDGLAVFPFASKTNDELLRMFVWMSEYGSRGMMGCPIDSLIDVTWQSSGNLFDDPPSLEECRGVITRLTYAGTLDDIRFTEQPVMFYRFQGGLTLWDGLRSAGLLRSVARTLARNPSDAQAQGRALESAIARAVESQLGVKTATSIKLKDASRNVVWEVDVAFAWRGVMFVIEAKHETKNIPYFFDSLQIKKRVERFREHLANQDAKVRAHHELLRRRLPGAQETSGCIAVVCSREVEFIASAERELWLTDSCPRICRLDELLESLPRLDAVALQTHPAFVPWAHTNA